MNKKKSFTNWKLTVRDTCSETWMERIYDKLPKKEDFKEISEDYNTFKSQIIAIDATLEKHKIGGFFTIPWLLDACGEETVIIIPEFDKNGLTLGDYELFLNWFRNPIAMFINNMSEPGNMYKPSKGDKITIIPGNI